MKNLFFLGLHLIIASNTFAQTHQSVPLKTWVDAGQKLVYFLPNPVLKLQVTHLGADDQFWDQLSVDLSYSETNPEFQAASDQLQATYPGDQFVKVLMSGATGTHVTIPSIGIDEDMSVNLSMDGPYFSKTYYVSKDKSAALALAYLSSDFISVSGQVQFSAPVITKVESQDLDASVCVDLFANGNTLYSVMGEYAKLSQKIDSLGLTYGSTKEMLKHSALTSCLNLPAPVSISSFQDLLSLPLEMNPNPGIIHGETSASIMTNLSSSFQPFTIKDPAK